MDWKRLLQYFGTDGDRYLPTIIKPSLFDRDPYQIYDCLSKGVTPEERVLVQRFTPYGYEWVDLIAIIEPYLPAEKTLESSSYPHYSIVPTVKTAYGVPRWRVAHIWHNRPIAPPTETYYAFDALPELLQRPADEGYIVSYQTATIETIATGQKEKYNGEFHSNIKDYNFDFYNVYLEFTYS